MARKTFEYILSADTRGFNKIDRARSGLNAFTSEVKDGSSSLGLFRTELVAVTGAALGLIGAAGAAGLGQMVADVTSGAREMENFARIAGMSVEQFTAFSYAVRTSGIEADKLADISKDVKDKIGDFIETGGGEFKDFMENVGNAAGLAAEELIKLSGPEALIAVKNAMDEVGVAADNQITYLEAIANDASLLLPLLANNGQKMRELARQAEEMGFALSGLDAAELVELDDIIKNFHENVGGTRREIVLALAPAIKDLATYLGENKDEIRDFAVSIAEAAGDAAKFAIENRETIAVLLKLGVALWGVSKAWGAVKLASNAMNAAALATTGTGLLANYTRLRTVLLSMQGFKFAGWFGVAGLIAYDIVAIKDLIDKYLEMRKLKKEIAQLEEENARSSSKLADTFREVSVATGLTITSMEELDAAVKDGKIHYDEATASWVRGASRIAAAVAESANTQKRVTGEALEAMKAKYRQYADEVKRLTADLTGMQQSLQERLRSMARSGMSDLGAWQDLKKQAGEYMTAAKQAAKAGNFEQAVQLAKKAEDAYADLNHEVKNGETTAITQQAALAAAMAGVKDAGEAAIAYQEQLIEQQKKAAAELNQASGGQLFDGLKNDAPELAALFADVEEKVSILKQATDSYAMAVVPEIGKAYTLVWDNAEKHGAAMIKEIELKTDKLVEKKREMEIDLKLNGPSTAELQRIFGDMTGVVAVAGRETGGLADPRAYPDILHFAGGGSPLFARLANPYITKGSGRRDDVPALLKKKEFVQPDWAVDHYGLQFMQMIRYKLFPVEMARNPWKFIKKFATGGSAGATLPAFSLPASSGTAAAPPLLGQYAHDFTFPGNASPVRVYADANNSRELIKGLQRMQRRSSR